MASGADLRPEIVKLAKHMFLLLKEVARLLRG
jgi:hypothetical protein